VIASFGSSTPYNKPAFDLKITLDPNMPGPVLEAPERYAKEPTINHQFRDDPKSPPKIISLVFTLAVLACVPALLIVWASLGANIKHAQIAMQKAPLAHAAFFGSLVAMEGIWWMYYTSWNLFQTLPAATVVGVVAWVSASRALTEVQERRLAGMR